MYQLPGVPCHVRIISQTCLGSDSHGSHNLPRPWDLDPAGFKIFTKHVNQISTFSQCLGAEYGETTLYLSITLAILVLTCLNQVELIIHWSYIGVGLLKSLQLTSSKYVFTFYFLCYRFCWHSTVPRVLCVMKSQDDGWEASSTSTSSWLPLSSCGQWWAPTSPFTITSAASRTTKLGQLSLLCLLLSAYPICSLG